MATNSTKIEKGLLAWLEGRDQEAFEIFVEAVHRSEGYRKEIRAQRDHIKELIALSQSKFGSPQEFISRRQLLYDMLDMSLKLWQYTTQGSSPAKDDVPAGSNGEDQAFSPPPPAPCVPITLQAKNSGETSMDDFYGWTDDLPSR